MDKQLKNVTKEDMKDFSSVGREAPVVLWILWGFVCGLCLFLALFVLGSGIPAVTVAYIVLCALTALLLIPTIYFSSENRIAQHKEAFVIFEIIGFTLSSLSLSSFLLYVAVGFIKTSGDDNRLYLLYSFFVLLVVFYAFFTVFFWKTMKKKVLSGAVRENDAIREMDKKLDFFACVYACVFFFSLLLIKLLLSVTSSLDTLLVNIGAINYIVLSFFHIFAIALHSAKLIGRYVYLSLFDMGGIIHS